MDHEKAASSLRAGIERIVLWLVNDSEHTEPVQL